MKVNRIVQMIMAGDEDLFNRMQKNVKYPKRFGDLLTDYEKDMGLEISKMEIIPDDTFIWSVTTWFKKKSID